MHTSMLHKKALILQEDEGCLRRIVVPPPFAPVGAFTGSARAARDASETAAR
jgi:hypothetical protein